MKFTPEIEAQINEVVEKQALQMAGADADKETLDKAKEIARTIIMESIMEAVAQQAKARKQALKERAAIVEDYNGFCQKEMNAPDFKAVQEYAVNDYFEEQTATRQRAIADAYSRIQKNEATAADIELVKEYFTEAKNAYHKRAAA